MDNIWDWAILDGCFGHTRIRPTDVDGLIERNGKCLFIETKQPGASIPYGQALMHKTLVRAGFSVLIVWGEKDSPCKIKLLTPSTTRTYEQADIETLRSLVSKWFTWADKQPRCWTKQEPKC